MTRDPLTLMAWFLILLGSSFLFGLAWTLGRLVAIDVYTRHTTRSQHKDKIQ